MLRDRQPAAGEGSFKFDPGSADAALVNLHDVAPTVTREQLDALLGAAEHLDVHFQPLIGFDTRAVVGAEALLRARLDGAPLSPIAVIEAATRAGRMREIGRHVLARACGTHAVWRAAGHGCLTMMVNIDATELGNPELASSTASILVDHGMPADRLVLELTETAFIEDLPEVRENLAALRALGVGLALDDFGAGYASLSHLRSVPLTMVKLDRQFVASVDGAGIDHEIVRNVIRLGHALGLRVVAEGVEKESQREALQALGCDAWQGFLRSPAVPFDQFLADLESSTSSVGSSAIESTRPADPADPVESLDSFVLRRIGTGRWAHLGGRGRGEGWAGIVEVDEAATPVIVRAAEVGVERVQHDEQQWLFGPYHPRAAVVIAVDHDTVVVFGSMVVPALPDLPDDEWTHLAKALADDTTTVSPAKRLADELEMSEALQGLISNTPDTLDEAMRHVVSSTAGALSCEFGVLYLPAAGKIAFDDHTIHTIDTDALTAALDGLSKVMHAPICVQNADEVPFPIPLPSDFRVRSWIALPTAPAFGGILVCAHTDRGPRGFTTLCQSLGRKLAEAAELVLYAGSEKERLAAAASDATVEARMDALTGLMNRRGWNDAVDGCTASEFAPVSVVIADLDDLKRVNDTEGHAAGDRLLVAAARCLSTLVRDVDVVARTGGDEFAILMRGADEQVCRRFVEQLDTLLDAERIEAPSLRISAGHATNDGTTRLDATVALADARMYAAKAASKRTAAAVNR